MSFHNSLNTPLTEFLRKHTAKKGITPTHTAIGHGRYRIPKEDLPEFIEKYKEHVFKLQKPACLTEIQPPCTPFKIDLDFRWYQSPNQLKRRYSFDNNSFISKLLQAFMCEFEKYMDMDSNENNRLCVVMEKKLPRVCKSSSNKMIPDPNDTRNERVKCKDGIHAMFPNVKIHFGLQEAIRDEVIKNEELVNKLIEMGIENSLADVVDKAILKQNGWLMYGSGKSFTEDPYKVSKYYDVFSDHVEEVNISINEEDLVDKLSLHLNGGTRDTMVLGNWIKPEMKSIVEKFMTDANKRSDTRAISRTRAASGKRTKINQKQIDLVSEYVDCLSEDRALSYKDWLYVGFCLHNIHNDDNRLLNKWIQFSRKPSIYANEPDETYFREWEKMEIRNEGGLGIGSLKYWAREDNPQRYRKIQMKDIESIVIRECSNKGKFSPNDAAKVAKLYYGEIFQYFSSSKSWYIFQGHRWKFQKGADCVILRKLFSEVLYEDQNQHNGIASIGKHDGLYGMLLSIGQEMERIQNDESKTEKGRAICTAAHRFKDTSYKTNVMKECQEQFLCNDSENFIDKIDKNNNLIGFENGVYDLEREEFRDGLPEDYICKSVGYDYQDPNSFPPESSSQIEWEMSNQEIDEFLTQIFPRKEVHDFMMMVLASMVQGGNPEEWFYIFSGSGGNGKSKLLELMQKALGEEYQTDVNVSFLTKERQNSEAPSPELADTKGARIVTFSEPDQGKKLQIGKIKQLSGGDMVTARKLNQDPMRWKFSAKMILTCNDRPELPPDEGGIWRRIIPIWFESKFVDKAKLTSDKGVWKNIDGIYNWEPKEQVGNREGRWFYPRDNDLSKKMSKWAPVFMYKLLQWHKEYKLRVKYKKHTIPPIVACWIDEYKSENNAVAQFIIENIEILDINDPNYEQSIMTITKRRVGKPCLWQEFQQWKMDEPSGNARAVKKQHLKDFLETNYSSHTNSREDFVRGMRIKNIDQNEMAAGITLDTDDLD